MNKIDLSGQSFSRLTVLGERPERAGQKIMWNCLCNCGALVAVDGAALKRGNTTSCGCRRSEVSAAKVRSHGMSKTATYGVWLSIKRRCFDPNNRSYKDYGGRGITMCAQWINDFSVFLRDMGEKPTGTVIDRADNSKGYDPNNCRWISQKENCRNKRNNVRLTHDGETRLLVEWAEHFGVSEMLLRKRKYRGLSDAEIFTNI